MNDLDLGHSAAKKRELNRPRLALRPLSTQVPFVYETAGTELDKVRSFKTLTSLRGSRLDNRYKDRGLGGRLNG